MVSPDTTRINTYLTRLINKINSLINTHYNISGSTSTKGHVQAGTNAGYADVSGGAVGTDNGVYARADHQHALSSEYATADHTHSEYLSSASVSNLESRVSDLENELDGLKEDLLA